MSEEQSGPLPKSPNERINLVATVTSLHQENKRLRAERDNWESRCQAALNVLLEYKKDLATAEAVVEAARKYEHDRFLGKCDPELLPNALRAYDAAKEEK